MAGVAITLGVQDAEAAAALRALSVRLILTRRRALTAIGAAMVLATQERFEAERGPDGQPWAPLRMGTVLRPVRRSRATDVPGGHRRGARNILRVSGRLYGSITYDVPPSAERVRWGTNVRYGPLHQLGGTSGMQNAGARAVPARPYLGISAADRAEIVATIADAMRGGIG